VNVFKNGKSIASFAGGNDFGSAIAIQISNVSNCGRAGVG